MKFIMLAKYNFYDLYFGSINIISWQDVHQSESTTSKTPSLSDCLNAVILTFIIIFNSIWWWHKSNRKMNTGYARTQYLESPCYLSSDRWTRVAGIFPLSQLSFFDKNYTDYDPFTHFYKGLWASNCQSWLVVSNYEKYLFKQHNPWMW